MASMRSAYGSPSLQTPSKIPEWSPENLLGSISDHNDDGAGHDNKKSTGGTAGGYLFRRSQSDPLIWYRRWCIVRGDCLWCCKSRL